jgi:hypothetical protein
MITVVHVKVGMVSAMQVNSNSMFFQNMSPCRKQDNEIQQIPLVKLKAEV